jgi:hypothetical protein
MAAPLYPQGSDPSGLLLGCLRSLPDTSSSVVEAITGLSPNVIKSTNDLGARYRFAVVPPASLGGGSHHFEACAVYQQETTVMACAGGCAARNHALNSWRSNSFAYSAGGCAPPLRPEDRPFCIPRGAGGLLSFWLPSTGGWRDKVVQFMEELMGMELHLVRCDGPAAPASLFVSQPLPLTPAPWWDDAKVTAGPAPQDDALLPGICFLSQFDTVLPLSRCIHNLQGDVMAKATVVADTTEADGRRAAFFDSLRPRGSQGPVAEEDRAYSHGLQVALRCIGVFSGNPNDVLAALICLAELAAAPLLGAARVSMLTSYLIRSGCQLAMRYYAAKGADVMLDEYRVVDLLRTADTEAAITAGVREREDDEYIAAATVASKARGASP